MWDKHGLNLVPGSLIFPPLGGIERRDPCTGWSCVSRIWEMTRKFFKRRAA